MPEIKGEMKAMAKVRVSHYTLVDHVVNVTFPFYRMDQGPSDDYDCTSTTLSKVREDWTVTVQLSERRLWNGLHVRNVITKGSVTIEPTNWHRAAKSLDYLLGRGDAACSAGEFEAQLARVLQEVQGQAS